MRLAIAAAFPDLRITSCAFLAEGWDSAAWEVNRELIFRFPKRAEVARWLARERALLPALAPALPAPIPRFTHLARAGAPADPALPFVGYPALRGTPLDAAPGLLRAGSPLPARLGAFLGALHAFPVERAVARGVAPGSWFEWVAGWRRFWARLAAAVPAFDARVARIIRATEEAFLDELIAAERPVTLVHHDLALEHILVDPDAGRIAGVIDWGDAAIGDPAIDFAALAPACDGPALAALLAAYERPRDDGFLRRARSYARLAPFHPLSFGLHTGDTGMVARGLAGVNAE